MIHSQNQECNQKTKKNVNVKHVKHVKHYSTTGKTDVELAEELFNASSLNDKALNDALQKINLTDVSPGDAKWDVHRQTSELVEDVLSKISQMPSKLDFTQYTFRVASCSTQLAFGMVENKYKLKEAWFCHWRHCPICCWRKSLIRKVETAEVLGAVLDEYPDFGVLFLTLTVKNCEVVELRDELKHMNNSYKKLMKRKELSAVVGWIRTTEVTRPKQEITKAELRERGIGEMQGVTSKNGKYWVVCEKTGNTHAHPHFHIILLVKPSYFKKHYISHQRWRELWRDCLGVDYLPQLNIQSLKQKNKNTTVDEEKDKVISINDAVNSRGDYIKYLVAEVVKYAMKTSDWLGNYKDPKSNLWTKIYTEQVHRMNFFAVGGIVKTKWKDLQKIENEEDITNQQMICADDELNNDDDKRRWRYRYRVDENKIGRGRYKFFYANKIE